WLFGDAKIRVASTQRHTSSKFYGRSPRRRRTTPLKRSRCPTAKTKQTSTIFRGPQAPYRLLNIQVNPRITDDVFDVESPAQDHLDRQRHHRHKQEGGDRVAHDAQLLEGLGLLGLHLPENHRDGIIGPDQQGPKDRRRHLVSQKIEARVLRNEDVQVDVGQGHDLVGIPFLPGREKVPARTAQEHAYDDKRNPEDEKTEAKIGNRKPALFPS